ncbi:MULTISPECIES: 4a-hydroxytetrahydrobiopterin dehydratase [Dactylosporangium]|uniref:Putative pterin-4-alpha-carbinolamine dehydratase n=2 Tax=Dactylosporangium TaxID=35753 RepID=A0A9W6NJJ9_9ACTN|nr:MULTISPECIES: 4a-hydroxytetrahydrobiopterin dehydratase [Dactylosporangium]UAB97544.1 4a-hydroxytetrahydrobiopterin dehydratase [Dactylosporangium vinaceum]UWZ45808.1 4a-hydroxytetrahydrobiopterin dehydratase [Dactylosporangium matsuzakiense]GLL00010.1 putative pterin-4-alpha-carbinolamine dehydratase [Dactylosporangium matsuzakiense]
MADVLGNDTLTAALADLQGWSGDAEGIERSVTAPAFLDGIRLVAEVAHVAEQADHHPDIDIRWRTVTFRLSTHSAGGVTEKDLALARQINELIG